MRRPVTRVKIGISAYAFKPTFGVLVIPTGTGQSGLQLEVTAFPGTRSSRRIHGKPDVADGGLLMVLRDPAGSEVWRGYFHGVTESG